MKLDEIVIHDKQQIIGRLIPIHALFNNGDINQIVYVFEKYFIPNMWNKRIDTMSTARYLKHLVNNELDVYGLDYMEQVIILKPSMPEEIIETGDTKMKSKFVYPPGVDVDTYVEQATRSLNYSINITTERIIRNFLNLPTDCFLISYIRNVKEGENI